MMMEEGQAQSQPLGPWQGKYKKTRTLLLMAKTPSYTCSKMPQPSVEFYSRIYFLAKSRIRIVPSW